MSDAILAPTDIQPAKTTEQQPNKLTVVGLLMGILIHPQATFKSLQEMKNGYLWLIFLITVIGLTAYTLVSTSVTSRTMQNFTPPAGMATSDADAGAGAFPAAAGTDAGATMPQATQSSALVTIIVPLVSGIAMILLSYAFRGLIAFGASMVLGGHSTFKQTFRMAIWTTIPSIFRYVVNSVAIATSSGRIVAGLSGMMTTMETRSLPFLNTLLGQIDIYAVWSMILFGIGITVTTKLGKGKSAITVLIYIAVVVLGLLIFYLVGNAVGGLIGGTQQGPGMMRGPRRG